MQTSALLLPNLRQAQSATIVGGAPAPLLLKLLVVSIFLPDEISFRVQGLLFSPCRLLLLVLTPVVVARLVSMIGRGTYRFVLSDLFVPVTGLWMIWALAHNETVQGSLTHAGPLALEFCIGYMAARTLLADGRQAIGFIACACYTIAVVALLGLLDTVASRFVIHDLMVSLTGSTPFLTAGSRLGLLRATSTLSHPILFGTICTLGLLLAISVPMRGQAFVVAACCIGSMIALSSAPIQGGIMGLGLLLYKRACSRMPFRWVALTSTLLCGIVIVAISVANPFGFVFNHLVFDAESAYYRMYTWQMASVAVSDSPWVGIGFVFPAEYEIPSTIDSIWLFFSLLFGVPCSVLLALSLLTSTTLPTSGPQVSLTEAESRLGLILGIMLCIIVFLGFTVHFFGVAWILIPLLAGVRARLGELGRTGTSGPSAEPASTDDPRSGSWTRRHGAYVWEPRP